MTAFARLDCDGGLPKPETLVLLAWILTFQLYYLGTGQNFTGVSKHILCCRANLPVTKEVQSSLPAPFSNIAFLWEPFMSRPRHRFRSTISRLVIFIPICLDLHWCSAWFSKPLGCPLLVRDLSHESKLNACHACMHSLHAEPIATSPL